MFKQTIVRGLIAAVLATFAVTVRADNTITLDMVPVGDAGNAADTTGYGAVSYNYQIGKYDVTTAQYTAFLNAVATTSDPYSLYEPYMATYFSSVGITRSAISGSYSYSVTGTAASKNSMPMFFVSWADAARFCNWLQNGQPHLPEGNGTTETGSYNLNGAILDSVLMTVTRNASAIYVIPSENEWYKAAYYDPALNGGAGGYWAYPTKSNTAPGNTLPDTGNHANFYDLFGGGNGGYTDPTNYLTPVGAFNLSPSAYGTFDQGGNICQWNETALDSRDRGLRGGAWGGYSNQLASSYRLAYDYPGQNEAVNYGFRVASVPEPGSSALILAGVVALITCASRRRWASLAIRCVTMVLILAAGSAQADVFNMPTGQTSLQFVTVGDAGNAADTTGYGAVGYTYQMGTFDVTVGQYCQFLNAVATNNDPYGLYNGYMATDMPTFGIAQNGSPGSYSYSVTGSYGQGANCPIFYISWDEAARFCNWLQNGQPTGAEGKGTTETGAYTLNEATSYSALIAIYRNADAQYFLPSEDEWYKAAYYNGGGTNAGYAFLPTHGSYPVSNSLALAGISNNDANYSADNWTDPVNRLTPVGTFVDSPTAYGAYDMGGNVWQWTDSNYWWDYGFNMRGGSFRDGWMYMDSQTYHIVVNPTLSDERYGFRVASLASVPEPSSIALLLGGAVALIGYAWRRRWARLNSLA